MTLLHVRDGAWAESEAVAREGAGSRLRRSPQIYPGPASGHSQKIPSLTLVFPRGLGFPFSILSRVSRIQKACFRELVFRPREHHCELEMYCLFRKDPCEDSHVLQFNDWNGQEGGGKK